MRAREKRSTEHRNKAVWGEGGGAREAEEERARVESPKRVGSEQGRGDWVNISQAKRG